MGGNAAKLKSSLTVIDLLRCCLTSSLLVQKLYSPLNFPHSHTHVEFPENAVIGSFFRGVFELRLFVDSFPPLPQ